MTPPGFNSLCKGGSPGQSAGDQQRTGGLNRGVSPRKYGDRELGGRGEVSAGGGTAEVGEASEGRIRGRLVTGSAGGTKILRYSKNSGSGL